MIKVYRNFMGRSAVQDALRNAVPIIAPSMLKCDFAHLGREVEALASAGAALLHFDVMDGHFVPNLSYGAMVIHGVRSLTDAPFEAHLMISEPARYVDEYLAAGCNLITFHIEAVAQPAALLRRIRAGGALAGLALNPQTPVDALLPHLGECDAVLVMSVEPGFGGQKFLPVALDKLARLKHAVAPTTLLSVDGGVGLSTIGACAKAGADLFVAGSSIFDGDDYRQAIDGLAAAARQAAVSAREH